MASPRDSRMLSVMNSIKCAGCGKAIDIMALGDHVCEASLVKAPAAVTPKKKLYGDPAIQSSPSASRDNKSAQPAAGGFFNWRKPAPPPMIDTSEANSTYGSPPELSGSDYSDENRSITPVTPSTQITSPGSTWSRGQPNKGLGIYTEPTSPIIKDEQPSEPAISETTTRLGGLWGGGLFKKLNNSATTGPFVAPADKALPVTPERKTPPSTTTIDKNSSEPPKKPQFRNAAGRNMLNLQNSAPSPMTEVFSSRRQVSNPADLYADIEASNPYASPTRVMDMMSPVERSSPYADEPKIQATPKTPQREGWYGFNSPKSSPIVSKFTTPEAFKNTRNRRNISNESSFWNTPAVTRMEAETAPIANTQHVRKPSFKTIDPAIQRPMERPMPIMNKPMFNTPASEPRPPKPKMFPEATPIGAVTAANVAREFPSGPAPRFRPPPVPRHARNEFDMYTPGMSSTPSSVNSSPERFPFGSSVNINLHGRKVSDVSSIPSSNASTTSSSSSSQLSRGGTPKHVCRGCSRPIFGRALRDSSGRLTGRYHRDCFRCSCCTAPFPSGEFYVLANEPLCKRDYHERNGSQCAKCRGGVEGRYVQTDDRKVFHDVCFGCVECDIPLGEEYWEVSGKPMCQRHAMIMAKMQSKVRPGLGILQGGGSLTGVRDFANSGVQSFESSAATYRSPQRRMTRYGMMGSFSRDRMGGDR